MWPNPFTEEILNGKLHFLCSDRARFQKLLEPKHFLGFSENKKRVANYKTWVLEDQQKCILLFHYTIFKQKAEFSFFIIVKFETYGTLKE